MKRKALIECMAYINEQNKKYKRITHFIVSEASRISRPDNVAEAFMLEEEIKATGVKIIKVDSSGMDETTDE